MFRIRDEPALNGKWIDVLSHAVCMGLSLSGTPGPCEKGNKCPQWRDLPPSYTGTRARSVGLLGQGTVNWQSFPCPNATVSPPWNWGLWCRISCRSWEMQAGCSRFEQLATIAAGEQALK
ncbi:uncharacterized protein CIMG_11664 [Coccidioides immitis RS]|uniref:Uncharacterized protein n=1 Tax=Coccidioides immitis (strain RS) TaxID=246410 RepID=A0A0D8JU65_COCIM|nr:uncharacterized protein CIMG_11664 [Coccidioides immitis RS]KJF60506.1 hypothetical protein CIMG_11664 [Coccidioides immitis RS]